MASITTIAASDIIANSRADINTNFSNLNSDKIETSVIDTDTALAANSDAKIASQKATKAYADSVAGSPASTTAKGVVEEATDAEIVAGTDTGGTGARLFVAPSKLNTQIALLEKSKKIEIDATEVTVAGGAGETTLFDVSIVGGTLSTNNGIRFRIEVSDLDLGAESDENLILKLKYGATTLATLTIAVGGVAISNLKGYIEGTLVADGATNAQKGFIHLYASGSEIEGETETAVTLSKASGTANGTAAEDSTAAKTLAITATVGGDATASITAEFWVVEAIK